MRRFGCQAYEYGYVDLDVELAAKSIPTLMKGHDSIIRASGKSPIKYSTSGGLALQQRMQFLIVRHAWLRPSTGQ